MYLKGTVQIHLTRPYLFINDPILKHSNYCISVCCCVCVASRKQIFEIRIVLKSVSLSTISVQERESENSILLIAQVRNNFPHLCITYLLVEYSCSATDFYAILLPSCVTELRSHSDDRKLYYNYL